VDFVHGKPAVRFGYRFPDSLTPEGIIISLRISGNPSCIARQTTGRGQRGEEILRSTFSRSSHLHAHAVRNRLVSFISWDKQALEVRVSPQGVKAKWVSVVLRKVETLPGGGQADKFYDDVGSPLYLWRTSEEFAVLRTVRQAAVFSLMFLGVLSGRTTLYTARFSVFDTYTGSHPTEHRAGERRYVLVSSCCIPFHPHARFRLIGSWDQV
jgi:hypothetical protein